MVESEVIVVGGGPAGSACAWKLKQNDVPTLILDKSAFPRPKLCAGWITPRVLKDLRIDTEEYPHSILTYRRLNYCFRGLRFPVRTRQYSIRRIEFDEWLVQRSGCEVIQHPVQQIRKENGHYILDDQFRCKYLVGAGGTYCKVYRAFFKEINPRARQYQITALEEEFPYPYQNPECYLWYFDHGLKGYSWYAPKGNGYLNVGIGGKLQALKERGETIREHWQKFIQKLQDQSLIKPRDFKPKGYNYFLRAKSTVVQRENAYIIGDAAGLASVDMGEGIGPAVKSGLLAAEAIINRKPYTIDAIGKFSVFDILFPRIMARFY